MYVSQQQTPPVKNTLWRGLADVSSILTSPSSYIVGQTYRLSCSPFLSARCFIFTTEHALTHMFLHHGIILSEAPRDDMMMALFAVFRAWTNLKLTAEYALLHHSCFWLNPILDISSVVQVDTFSRAHTFASHFLVKQAVSHHFSRSRKLCNMNHFTISRSQPTSRHWLWITTTIQPSRQSVLLVCGL